MEEIPERGLSLRPLLLRAGAACRLALALGRQREAERSIRALLRRPERCAKELGRALEACLHAARGERQHAILLLEAALPGLNHCGLGLYAIAVRHRLSVLSGDAASELSALEERQERGVRVPHRFLDALLPLRPCAAPASLSQASAAQLLACS
jgi:hypothetical protein